MRASLTGHAAARARGGGGGFSAGPPPDPLAPSSAAVRRQVRQRPGPRAGRAARSAFAGCAITGTAALALAAVDERRRQPAGGAAGGAAPGGADRGCRRPQDEIGCRQLPTGCAAAASATAADTAARRDRELGAWAPLAGVFESSRSRWAVPADIARADAYETGLAERSPSGAPRAAADAGQWERRHLHWKRRGGRVGQRPLNLGARAALGGTVRVVSPGARRIGGAAPPGRPYA